MAVPDSSPDDELDILSVIGDGRASNKIFRVTFDFFTPRAHFVILGRSRDDWHDFTEMSEDEQMQLIWTAKSVARTLELPRAILSIHRGKWVHVPHFHCHVCCDVTPYLEVFRDVSKKPPMCTWWPDDVFVTKEWRSSSNPRSYEKNVSGYPFKNFKSFELQAIKRVRRPLCEGLQSFRGHQLVYHTEARRVGLVGCFDNDVPGLLAVLHLLEDLVNHLGLTKANREGCHVCVDLTGNGFDDFDTTSPVYGYLQVSGAAMFKNCPRDQRDSWLSNFRQHDDKVYT